MVIRQIYMEHIGAIREKRISLVPGLNIVEGENESGKTTAAAFLCFLFYGILPPQFAGTPVNGWVEFVCHDAPLLPEGVSAPQGTLYRLERAGGEQPLTALYTCENDTVGTCLYRSSDPTEEPGGWFFGVPAHVFAASAYVGQVSCAGRGEGGGSITSGEAIRAAMERILYAADASLDVKGALAHLREKQKALYDPETGIGTIADLEKQRETLSQTATQDPLSNGSEPSDAALSMTEMRGEACALPDHGAEIAALDERIRACDEKIKEKEARCEKLRAVHDRYLQYTAMKEADALPELVMRVRAAEKRASSLTKTMFRGTYIPDTDFAASLHLCAVDLAAAQTDLCAIGEEEKKLAFSVSRDNFKENRIRRVSLDGGAEAVMAKLDKLSGARTAVTVFGILFLVFAVFALATTIFLIVLHTDAAKNGILITACLAALSGFFFFSRARYEKNVGVMLTRYNCTTENELENFLEESDLSEGKLQALDENKDGLEKRRTDASLRATEAGRQAARLLSKLQPPDTPSLRPEKLNAEIIETAASRIDRTLAEIALQNEQYLRTQQEITEMLSRHGADSVASLLAKRKELAAMFEGRDGDAEKPAIDIDAVTRELDFHTKALASFAQQRGSLLSQRDALVSAQNVSEHATAAPVRVCCAQNALPDSALRTKLLSEMDETLHDMRRDYAAYTLAISTLTEASESLHAAIAPRLTANAGRMMRILTGGRFGEPVFDDGMSMTAAGSVAVGDTETERVELERLSAGTQELAYLSLRMALVPMLYPTELPPFVFDEAFATLDDKRLARMIALLIRQTDEESRQAIIFTCHKRERRAAEAIGTCHVVRLS